MKIAFYTLGCKVNQYETNIVKEKFEKDGFEIVNDDVVADVYCINSCSVTNMSDRKTRQAISRMRKQNREAIIVVMGCYVESSKEQGVGCISLADIVIDNSSKGQVVERVLEYINSKEKNNRVIDIDKQKEYIEIGKLEHGYDVRESIKIEDGCNNFCSYCIIPYVRGRVRSRKLEEILEEVKNLAARGVKEIILVGIEITSYGEDTDGVNLIDVVETVADIEGIVRVRLSSLHPTFLTKDNILRLKAIPKFCDHFHLSLQSGCSEVLKNMNRKYTKEDILRVCNDIHEVFDRVNITADIIVGFPGETDTQFEDTVDTLKRAGISELHVFKYSKRRYTRAEKMENQVDGNIKKERSRRLLELSAGLKKQYMIQFINTVEKVLIDECGDGTIEGYTKKYVKVKVHNIDKKEGEKLWGSEIDLNLICLEKEAIRGQINKE